MKNRPLRDPELESYLPRKTREEQERLNQQVLEDGRIHTPVIVWQEENIIVDGYGRDTAADELGMTYDIFYKSFPDRLSVKEWMIENQMARRNLDDLTKLEYAVKLFEIKAARRKEKTLQNLKQNNDSGKPADLSNSDIPEDGGNTRREIAEFLGWSLGNVARGMVVLKEATEEMKEELKQNKVKLNSIYHEIQKAKKQAKKEREKQAQVKPIHSPEHEGRPLASELPPEANGKAEAPADQAESGQNDGHKNEVLGLIYGVLAKYFNAEINDIQEMHEDYVTLDNVLNVLLIDNQGA